ncbi:metallophosphatase [Bacteroides gallinaceum]|uniref:Metallophosphatase n=2 Tax=Bacteroidaceae TaxID=815 RepID=A0ABT7X8N5_9BACE|nr:MULTISPECIES: metallophosphatase [Bacteroidaceae]CCZ69542.1 5'-nucleotidase [Bacteroides sp. CAG:702]HJD11660.1 metallophosphatase [Candidatus Phocaeicola caecigallinarum]MBD8041947.1 metallophosphatase [Phocaeicola intestinalis]MBM6659477.1 metallophosphatase [Bacteroides gallinaceum]MBM6721267.1 metallophosphatase [Bacteroides gallinaceum]
MKKLCLISLWVCLLVVTAAAQSTKEIYLFHTNDMHSRIEPFPENYQDTLLAGKAGMVRRATFISQQREIHPDLLLFDCGDFSQGTPYYNIYKGEVEISMMNEMRYDAGTIGNHEFDFGLENMARLFRLAEFPIVCANYDVTGTVLEGLVKEYVVLHRDGIKIGVFGLGAQLEGLVAKASYGDVKFEDPVSEAQRIADLLKMQEKCDLVICLSHLGWKGEPYSDVELIENTCNIDVVLGGHSHSYFEKPEYYKNLDGVEVPLQQMGKHAAFIGKMVLTLQKN